MNTLYVIIGGRGAGKTYAANHIFKKLGFQCFDQPVTHEDWEILRTCLAQRDMLLLAVPDDYLTTFLKSLKGVNVIKWERSAFTETKRAFCPGDCE